MGLSELEWDRVSTGRRHLLIYWDVDWLSIWPQEDVEAGLDYIVIRLLQVNR